MKLSKRMSINLDYVYNFSRYKKSIYSNPLTIGLDIETGGHALLDGEVVIAVNDAGNKEYGGLVVLKHTTTTLEFYTLYGHLTVASATQHTVGDQIKKGEKIAELGNYPENGNWAPHLHFQIMLSLFNYTVDFPGVAYFSELNTWKSICPNPNLLFKSEALQQHVYNFNS